MTHAVERLLSDFPDAAEAPALARRVGELADQLIRHLARVVGEIGVVALFRRSVVLASASCPWLVSLPATGPATPAGPALGSLLASRSAPEARRSFVIVLSIFVGLLARLIGEALVRQMLYEVWPAAFHTEGDPRE